MEKRLKRLAFFTILVVVMILRSSADETAKLRVEASDFHFDGGSLVFSFKSGEAGDSKGAILLVHPNSGRRSTKKGKFLSSEQLFVYSSDASFGSSGIFVVAGSRSAKNLAGKLASINDENSLESVLQEILEDRASVKVWGALGLKAAKDNPRALLGERKQEEEKKHNARRRQGVRSQ